MQPPFDKLLDSLDVGLIAVDANGLICYRNTAAGRWLTGAGTLDAAFSAARFLGRFDGWPEELVRIRQAGAPVNIQCAVRPEAAAPAVLLTLRCCSFQSTGDDGGAVILLQEGPPTEVLDERLEVSKRLASLGKLAARVAHELNNPLDGILRYINLALRIVNDTPETKLKAYLAESRTGLMRMVQIIGDLLEFSRTTEGDFDESDINEVVEQAIKANSAAASRGGVVTTADFQTQPMPVTRGSRLYQVCCNLIRNAVDAMPDGGRLCVTTGVMDEQVVIRIADTGVGLPAQIEKIFEPFYTTKAPGKGTGLGLAICKDFIEDMKGTITAAPGDEGGAVFTIRIPVQSFRPPTERQRLRISRRAGRAHDTMPAGELSHNTGPIDP